MVKIVDAEEFLKKAEILPVIDVRSPGEFAQGHIPGAINIPIFDDDERARVGTRYKKSGHDPAVLLGLEFVGPKLASFVKLAKKYAVKNELLVHCWRGGKRSASMAWLFETGGLQPVLLDGGYKAYRHYIRTAFETPARILILGGMTGSGKTELLHYLHDMGEQIIDLEGLAHHKGSAFGALGQEPQPSNEQFENNIAQIWFGLKLDQRIWIEDESRSIGKVSIVETLYKQMRVAPVMKIFIPVSDRVKRLLVEYGDFSVEELGAAVDRITKRLGGLEAQKAIEALVNGDLKTVAEITLFYYDKAYQFAMCKRINPEIIDVPLMNDDHQNNAKILLDFVNSEKL